MQPVCGEEHEAALHERQHALLQLQLGLDVEVGRGLVEHEHAPRTVEQRAGERDALPLPARQRAAALAHERAQALGQLGHEPLEPHGAHRALNLLVGGVGTVERDVLAQRGMEEVRILRDVDHLALPRGLAQIVQPPARRENRARARRQKAAEDVRERALARAARADDADPLESAHGEGHVGKRLAVGIREPHAGQLEDGPLAPRGNLAPAPRHPASGSALHRRAASPLAVLRRCDDPLYGRERVLSVERGVVVACELADGLEVLGHEHEHEQRREEGDRAVHQPEPQHDGHGGQRQRGDEVEHRSGQRGDAQRLHRGLAEALAHLEDALPVAFALAEQLERVDAAHRVDEVVGQPPVLVVLARGGRLRRLADQPHVEHDDRIHDEHDQARHPIDGQHAQKHHERHGDHAHDLRQHEAHVRLHLVDALEGQGGHAARARLLHDARALLEHRPQKAVAQLLDARAGVAAKERVLGAAHALRAHEAGEEQGDARRLARKRLARPQADDGARERPRLAHREQRARRRERQQRREHPANALEREQSAVDHRKAPSRRK